MLANVKSALRCATILALTFAQSAQSAQSAFSQSAPAKRAITHQDLWLIKRVGAPALSPDGVWAAFSVAEPAYNANEQVSDLWIVRTDGSAPARRLTATKGGESGLAWSPDSRRLAFVAKREGDEAAQVYVLDVSTPGEAQRVTSISTGARTPVWRPDGGALLFTSSVFPGTTSDSANKRIAKERQGVKYKVRAYDSFPIRNWDHWLTDSQAHLFAQTLDGTPARDLFAGTKLVASAGYAGVGSSGDDDLDATWSPDGRTIVFAATTGSTSAAYAFDGTQLYRTDANGGEPQRITSDNANWHNPRFSADGRTLYARFEPVTPDIFAHSRLASFTWPNASAPANLTASFDRSVDTYSFSPDGKTIYLTAEDQGHPRIYRMAAGGGMVSPLAATPVGAYGGVAIGGNAKAPVMVTQWQSSTRPPEIVRVDVANGTHHELTSFTSNQIASLDLPPLREFWITTNKGRRVRSYLQVPPNFDESKKYPLLVVMHGGPAGAHLDSWGLRWNYHLLAAPGYVLVMTDYTGSTGYSEEFGRAIKGDPLRTPADEINASADEAIRLYPFIDASRQAAAGASYGGHLAYWMEATTTRYRAIVAHAGAINPETQWGTSDGIYHREIMFGGPVWERGDVWKDQNAMLYAPKYKTPILLTVGERDFRVPLNNTLQAWSLMQRMKVPSRLLVFPEENHWITDGEDSKYWFGEVQAWLAKYLTDRKASE